MEGDEIGGGLNLMEDSDETASDHVTRQPPPSETLPMTSRALSNSYTEKGTRVMKHNPSWDPRVRDLRMHGFNRSIPLLPMTDLESIVSGLILFWRVSIVA